jgi:hypothetical protein
MARLLLVAAAVSLVLAACDAADSAAIHPESTGSSTTAVRTAVPSRDSVGFSAPQYGLSLEMVPDGFVTWREIHEVKGPGPGWVQVYQEFHNDQTGQAFILSVGRGKPSELSIKDPDGEPLGTESTERVHGYRTYFFDLRAITGQLQYGWVIEPDVTGWMTTYKMTAEETLELARQVDIAS